MIGLHQNWNAVNATPFFQAQRSAPQDAGQRNPWEGDGTGGPTLTQQTVYQMAQAEAQRRQPDALLTGMFGGGAYSPPPNIQYQQPSVIDLMRYIGQRVPEVWGPLVAPGYRPTFGRQINQANMFQDF